MKSGVARTRVGGSCVGCIHLGDAVGDGYKNVCNLNSLFVTKENDACEGYEAPKPPAAPRITVSVKTT